MTTENEAKSGLSRRAVLQAAPALAAAPLAALAASGALAEETPELLQAAREAGDAVSRHNAAREAYRASYDRWSKVWPLAPEPCVEINPTGLRCLSHELGVDGLPLVRQGQEHPMVLHTAEWLETLIGNLRSALAKDSARAKPRISARQRKRIENDIAGREMGAALLPGYLAECERIKEAAGLDRLAKERSEAREAAIAAIWQVLALPHRTAAGLRAKAEAVAAIGRMGGGAVALHFEGFALENGYPSIAAVMAEAVLQPI